MVAVDKDKNSAYAFRWAVTHLDNPVIIAVHVKNKNLPNRRYLLTLLSSHHFVIIHIFRFNTLWITEGTNVFPPDEDDVSHIFNNLRAMCQRKTVSSLIFIEISFEFCLFSIFC